MKLVLFSIATVFSSFVLAKDLHSGVELTWKATTDLTETAKMDLSKMSEAKIKVEKLSDARTIKPATRVGEYSENPAEVLPVDTKSDVSEFITANLKNTLTKVGLDVADKNTQYTLTGEIKEFYVTETNTYKGNVLIKFILKKGDKVVWSGPIQGINKRFGRTYKLDNYMESLSDSVLDATLNLLKNEGFRKTWN